MSGEPTVPGACEHTWRGRMAVIVGVCWCKYRAGHGGPHVCGCGERDAQQGKEEHDEPRTA